MSRRDRALRRVAQRLARSRVLLRVVPRATNARGDRLDAGVAVMLWLQRLGAAELSTEASVAEMRAAMTRSCLLGASDPPQVASRDDVRCGLPVRWYEPDGARGALIFLHGGGWVVGGLDSHDALCRHLAVGARRTVLAVDYPLAPEHPWPAAIDAVSALAREHLAAWAAEGLAPQQVAIGGDSAGANLSTTVCMRLRDQGAPLPGLQLLVYPGLDPLLRCDSHAELAEGYVLTRASIERYVELYRPDPRHALGCPLDAPDLAGLPPAVVTVAGFDPLRDEGLRYAERLVEAGVPTTLIDEPGLTHGYLNYDGLCDEAARARDRVAAALEG